VEKGKETQGTESGGGMGGIWVAWAGMLYGWMIVEEKEEKPLAVSISSQTRTQNKFKSHTTTE